MEDPKIAEKVMQHRDLILKNRRMVTLDKELPLPLAIERMGIVPNYPELIAALREFGFRSLTADVEKDQKALAGESNALDEIGSGEVPEAPSQGELFG